MVVWGSRQIPCVFLVFVEARHLQKFGFGRFGDDDFFQVMLQDLASHWKVQGKAWQSWCGEVVMIRICVKGPSFDCLYCLLECVKQNPQLFLRGKKNFFIFIAPPVSLLLPDFYFWSQTC